jgi:hypothetical protein
MQQTAVEDALVSLRPGLAADGFNLKIGSLDAGGAVQIILEARPDACLDCLVPDQMMVLMLADAIRQRDPSLNRVELLKEGFDATAVH